MSRHSIYQVFGNNVQRLRKERAMTQEALATAAMIDRSYLAKLETGKGNPSIKMICDLANALHVHAAELVKTTRDRRKYPTPLLHF